VCACLCVCLCVCVCVGVGVCVCVCVSLSLEYMDYCDTISDVLVWFAVIVGGKCGCVCRYGC